MAYPTIFVSSEREEKRRRDLLSGSRSFSFMGYDFYYSYSKSLISLKEEVIYSCYKIERRLEELGVLIKNEYINSSLLNEISASCSIDGYPYLRRLENLYLKEKEFLLLKREKPLKNLSLKVGFSVSSPCKNLDEISKGMDSLETWKSEHSDDVLICALVEHFLFEFIHPYETMNGPIGRYQIYQCLKGTPYELIGIKLSSYLYSEAKGYFLSFKRAETSMNINDYLEGILSIISKCLSKDLHDLEEKAKRWEIGLKELGKFNLKHGEYETFKGILMMKIFRSQKLNLSRLALVLGKSERTVFRHALELNNLKLINVFDTPK